MRVSIEMTAEEAAKGIVVRVSCDGVAVEPDFPKKNEEPVVPDVEVIEPPVFTDTAEEVEGQLATEEPPALVEEPVVQEEPEPEPETEVRPVKGFILSKCPRCGFIKSFFTREFTTYNKCRECGHEYTLDGNKMIPIFAKCQCCEREIKWRTDLTGEFLELDCKNCGSPIDLELNAKGTAYVTIEDRRTK